MSRRLRELAALARVGKEPGPRNLESKHVYYSFFVKSGKIVGQGCENAFHITRSFTPTVKCVLATRQLCINQFAVVVRPLNFIFNPLSSVWPSIQDRRTETDRVPFDGRPGRRDTTCSIFYKGHHEIATRGLQGSLP